MSLQAEPSGMLDNGKSKDNGSATTTVLFRTTRFPQRKSPGKANSTYLMRTPRAEDICHYDPPMKRPGLTYN